MSLEAFAKRLRHRREELGFTQRDLANETGLTFQAVSLYERAAEVPLADALFALAHTLEMDIRLLWQASPCENEPGE